MYCYQEELFRISGVVVPYPLIHISTGKETYSSEYSSPSREIKNEAGQAVASLTKSSENEYVLKDADGELEIVREMDCYYGKVENTVIFVARKIDDLWKVKGIYGKQEYDLTYGHKLTFYQSITEA